MTNTLKEEIPPIYTLQSNGDGEMWNFGEGLKEKVHCIIDTRKHGSLSIENLLREDIDTSILERICEMEREARGMEFGEYTKCNSCGKIYGKKDIYPDNFNESLSLLEENFELPNCSCGGDMQFMYPRDEYLNNVLGRHRDSEESYITVLKDKNGVIRGICEGCVLDFENNFNHFYDKTLSDHYPPPQILKSRIKEIVKDKLKINDFPEKMFFWCSVVIEEDYRDIKTFYSIISNFFNSVDIEHSDMLGFGESRVGIITYLLHLSIKNNFSLKISDIIADTDIFDNIRLLFSPGGVNSYKKLLNMGPNTIFKRIKEEKEKEKEKKISLSKI